MLIVLFMLTLSALMSVRDSYAFQLSVATGYNHTVGLRANGTVVAVGDNRFGQCNVTDWDGYHPGRGGCSTHSGPQNGRHGGGGRGVELFR
jgi:alpha-tubulin suppressor-like RCC1 family protein